MGYLKGKMALRLFQQYESLGRRYWERHLWAHGYCVSTVGLDEATAKGGGSLLLDDSKLD